MIWVGNVMVCLFSSAASCPGFLQCGFTVSGGALLLLLVNALLVAVHGSQTDGGSLEADDASGATLHLSLSLPLINWVTVSLTSLLQVPPLQGE